MAAAVVSRTVVLSSRLAPSECHGSHHVQHPLKQPIRNLWHGSDTPSAWMMCCPASNIEARQYTNWGKYNQVKAPGNGSGSQVRAASGSGSLGVTQGVEADTTDEEEASTRTGLSIGQVLIQGLRDEMEDDIAVQDGPLGFTYVGVFDGHAGFGATNFVRRELYQDLVNCLEGGKLLESSDQTALQDAFDRAFQQTDSRLLSWLDSLESDSEDKDAGTTATVVFMSEDSVTVAHVGDSRTVMSQNGKAVDLSADHRPYGSNKTAISEVNRIKKAGGWVHHGRVCSTLSVSRAFGDIPLKLRRREMLEEGIAKRRWTRTFAERFNLDGVWLSVTPDVKQIRIGEDVEFIIVASDGLWDSFKSKDAVKFVTKQLQKHGDVQQAAEAIVQASLERHSQDNISVVILDLGRIPLGETGLSSLKWW